MCSTAHIPTQEPSSLNLKKPESVCYSAVVINDICAVHLIVCNKSDFISRIANCILFIRRICIAYLKKSRKRIDWKRQMNSLIVGKKRTVYTKNRHNRKINPPPPPYKKTIWMKSMNSNTNRNFARWILLDDTTQKSSTDKVNAAICAPRESIRKREFYVCLCVCASSFLCKELLYLTNKRLGTLK